MSKKDIEENARKLFDKKYGWSSLDFEFKGEEVKMKNYYYRICKQCDNVGLNLKKKTNDSQTLLL